MPRTLPSTVLTPRDLDILSALDRLPLTVEQLMKLSTTFPTGFGSSSRVRGRLGRLREAGWVQRFRYVTAERGTPADYYRLTLAGYRMLHGPQAEAPSKRHFSQIGVAGHFHSRCLTDAVIHLLVAAHAADVRVTQQYAENTLRLSVGEESLYPDGALQMVTREGTVLNYCIELDAGTERVTSEKARDSVQRKISLYERYQDTVDERLRVLFLTTRSMARVDHVLRVAAHLARNPNRRLIYAANLQAFLQSESPLMSPCFHDHQGSPVSLLPASPVSVQPPHNSHSRPMVTASAPW